MIKAEKHDIGSITCLQWKKSIEKSQLYARITEDMLEDFDYPNIDWGNLKRDMNLQEKILDRRDVSLLHKIRFAGSYTGV